MIVSRVLRLKCDRSSFVLMYSIGNNSLVIHDNMLLKQVPIHLLPIVVFQKRASQNVFRQFETFISEKCVEKHADKTVTGNRQRNLGTHKLITYAFWRPSLEVAGACRHSNGYMGRHSQSEWQHLILDSSPIQTDPLTFFFPVYHRSWPRGLYLLVSLVISCNIM